jgi:hypothetical protein
MKRIISVFVSLFLTLGPALSQSGGTFVIEKSVIASGAQSAGGTFDLAGTLGEPIAGNLSSGGTFSVSSGFWQAASVSMMGTVTYGNPGGAPNPRFVSNAIITGAGSPTVMTTTAPPGATAGRYALTGFGSGAYTVTPTKTTGQNGISSFDAGLIALHVAGPPNPQLNANQLIAADVSGNGSVTSFDAGMIAKFVAGPPYAAPGIGATSTWKFFPANRNYASVTSNVAAQDYTAYLMGEVSGNWNNTGTKPVESIKAASDDARTGPQRNIVVTAPHLAASTGKEVIVPINAEGLAKKGIISYEFDLRYDPNVIQPAADTMLLAGTLSRGLSGVANSLEAGLLRVVVYGAAAINYNGLLLNLRFKAVGQPGSASRLTWDRVIFNEGDAKTMVIDGSVELSADASN